jgi:mannosyl-oligosaccharide alpha-1,2-mannosidase
MRLEVELAVNAVRQIGFAKTDEQTLKTFETTIRYLGGFLAAYDLSGCIYQVLLENTIELGELLCDV